MSNRTLNPPFLLHCNVLLSAKKSKKKHPKQLLLNVTNMVAKGAEGGVQWLSWIVWSTRHKCNFVTQAGESHYIYNCHNIYWDPLIWLVKNGHLIRRIDLYFIIQWTRPVFMRGGAIHDRTTFVILCNASMKRNGQPATTHLPIFRWKSKDYLTYDA